jgi:predicted ArsR family transcriptional regulator
MGARAARRDATAVVGPARPEPAPQAEARTRDRVLQSISEQGPVTAAALAERLGLTAAAVRRHLDNLAGAGLIASRDQPGAHRGRGRPARAYVVSASGHQALEADYEGLAADALRFLARTGGDALDRFVRERAQTTLERYAGQLASAGSDPAARAEALVAALTADGYAASARPVGGSDGTSRRVGIQLCQGHCPVQHAAREFPQLCDAETEVFSRLLGVHVQRLATLAHGEHVCTTFIPLQPAAATEVESPPTERSTR